jgi:hypothetical protein
MSPATIPALADPEPVLSVEGRVFACSMARPLQKFLSGNSQPAFTTSVTPHLRLFEGDLRHFRPAAMTRDVNVLERGYWEFWVKMEKEQGLHVAKQPRQSKMGVLALSRPDEHHNVERKSATVANSAPWTADAFSSTWDRIASFIQRGRAGRETWVVKEAFTQQHWRVRLFTFAEILPHAWFLLFNFSDALTGKMAMDWVAGDGQVVVQMRPGKNLVGSWTRPAFPGIHGVCGFTQG